MTSVFGYCKSDPNIPIDQLDYAYIEKCKDINKLQKILEILRSGEEGRYPALEQFTEKQLAEKKPDSDLLEKNNREQTIRDLPKDERESAIDDLKSSLSSFPTASGVTWGEEDDENLPPIRNTSNVVCEEASDNVKKTEKVNENKKAAPRSYEEWQKLDKHLENGDDDSICKEKSSKGEVNSTTKSKQAHELLSEQKNKIHSVTEELSISAQNEKNKGNEAFRCGDFKEALVYYNRSLDILPTPASYNNRAITYIKLERFNQSLDDCNEVIRLEAGNIKAYMRRGISQQSLKNYEEAKQDFKKVLELEPTNKRGKELLEKVSKELAKKGLGTKKKGSRLKIEEINTHVANEDLDKNNLKEKIVDVTHECTQKDSVKVTEIDSKKRTLNKCEEDKQPWACTTKDTMKTSNNLMNERTEGHEQVVDRPTEAVATELPSHVTEMKNKGLEFYKTGRYHEASQSFTSCIHTLSGESAYTQALATFFSNRGSCFMKMGNTKDCIHDCDKSLEFVNSTKVYLKRAAAYESSEKYINAYVDYQNALQMDSANGSALQGTSRLGKVLRDEHGINWREKIPKTEVVAKPDTAPLQENVKSLDNDAVNKVFKSFGVQNLQNLMGSSHVPSNSMKHLSDPIEKVKVSEESPQTEGSKNSAVNNLPPAVTTRQNQVESSAADSRKETVCDNTNDAKETKDLKDSDAGNDSIPKELQEKEKEVTSSGIADETGTTKSGKIRNIKITPEKAAREKRVLDFFDTKENGNACVQQGKYADAAEFYTKCAELMPNEIASYNNRSLCYLKLNQPGKAMEDCTQALKIVPNNVKALFRRAQAWKMMKSYKEALADFTNVLKLEPNNNVAKKEMEQCKADFMAALRDIQAKNEAAKHKRSKKIPIEEVLFDHTESSTKGKMSTKTGQCPLAKGSSTKSPSLKKMTGFEFLHAWNNIKSNKTTEYAELLTQIDASKLPDMLSNKLDGEILKNFIRTVNEHFTDKESYKQGIQLMKSLCRASRFVTMLMFLSTTEMTLLRGTIELLETRVKQNNEKNLFPDIGSLRMAYRCP